MRTMPRVSQYPPPYPPMPYGQPPIDPSYFQPGGDLLLPARRAALLQMLLAAGMCLCCVGVGIFPWVVNVEDMVAQSGVQLPPLPPGWSLVEMLRLAYGFMAVGGVTFGITLLLLGLFVRRGGGASAVVSIVIEGFILLLLGIYVIAGIVQSAGSPAGLAGVVLLLIPIALVGLNMKLLMAAIRNRAAVAAAQQMYQAQMYGYFQQQQAYAQAGYGYSYLPQQQQPQPYMQQPSSPAAPPGPNDADPPPT